MISSPAKNGRSPQPTSTTGDSLKPEEIAQIAEIVWRLWLRELRHNAERERLAVRR